MKPQLLKQRGCRTLLGDLPAGQKGAWYERAGTKGVVCCLYTGRYGVVLTFPAVGRQL